MPDRKQAPKIVDAVNFDLRLKQAAQKRYSLLNGFSMPATGTKSRTLLQLPPIFYCATALQKEPLFRSTNILNILAHILTGPVIAKRLLLLYIV